MVFNMFFCYFLKSYSKKNQKYLFKKLLVEEIGTLIYFFPDRQTDSGTGYRYGDKSVFMH